MSAPGNTTWAGRLKNWSWIPGDQRKDSFWAHIRRRSFVLVLIALLLFGDWLGKTVVFEPAATWLSDVLLRTRTTQVPRYTRLIQIDETDREKVLNGRTPVDGVALVQAICTLAASKPAVIVVDLDTSRETSFPKHLKSLPDFHGVPVVWGVNARWEQADSGLRLASDRYLSGRIAAPNYGIARMPAGFDGFVRGWFDGIEVNGASTPSLTAKALELCCRDKIPSGKSHATSFSVVYQFPPLQLRDFVPDKKQAAVDAGTASAPLVCPPRALDSAVDPRLEKILVVLGAVHPTEDRHETAWGTKSGVELVAMSMEESLNPHNLGHLHWTVKWLLKLALALGIAALHHFFWPIAATLMTVLLLPLAVFGSALASFYFGEYELATIPLVIGILVEQLATSAEKGEHHARHAHVEE